MIVLPLVLIYEKEKGEGEERGGGVVTQPILEEFGCRLEAFWENLQLNIIHANNDLLRSPWV